MPQWFLKFSEFPEFSESSAPFRENPNRACLHKGLKIWDCHGLADWLSGKGSKNSNPVMVAVWSSNPTGNFILFSFRRELSVMQMLAGSGKILCQNLLVHPKCILGGSNKLHILPSLTLPSPLPPTYINENFGSGRLWNFDVVLWTLVDNLPHPTANGNLGF